MQRSASELFNYTLDARDGEIGRCKDYLFDDQFWAVRQMVADTGKWLPGRRVWISSISLGAPVNRAYDNRLYDYYGRPKYWR